jgi:3-oxoacyl-[acyl-carrier-protein] synthase II
MKRRVVITGMGAITPLGCSVDAMWQGLLAAKSGVKTLTTIKTDDFKINFGGDIPEFDASNYMSPRDAKRVDRFTHFAVAGCKEAVADSGIDFSEEDSFRCGVILGSGIGGLCEIEKQMEKLLYKGPDRVSPMTIPKLMLNAAGGNISIEFGLRGPNYTVATACASATNAIGDAFKSIQYGDADVMITGGTEAALTRMGMAGFQNMKALSDRNDEPARASRPFDLDRDGFVLSEGAGILVIEELERAKARGANIHAEIFGFGASGDAGHITQPDDQGSGAGRAMQCALDDAGVNPEDIGYINAHGTSTPLGDKAETQAIKRVFGEHAYKVSISSTKSQLGHSLGASGGMEAIIVAKALRHAVIPPTINLETPDPACDLDYTPLQAKEVKATYGLSNSFGFGGHNACLVVGDVL